VFTVVLGSLTPLPLTAFTGTKLWLLTTVNSIDILPRRPLVAVAYSFRSAVVDSAVKGSADLWTAIGPDINRTSGFVGIDTPDGPSLNLDVYAPGGTSQRRPL
jgi:hypothetical protein